MKVLAFAGLRKAGKTTLANEIIRLAGDMGLYIRKISFAASLKQMYCSQYNVLPEELEDPILKEAHRASLEAFSEWVKKESGSQTIFIDDMWDHIGPEENIVIDDLRRIEELESVMVRGGVPYKVEADKAVRAARGFKYDPRVDDSLYETELGTLTSETFYCLGGGVVYNNKGVWEQQPKLREIILDVFLARR